MRKKIISAALAFMLAAVSLGGCGQEGKEAADQSVITIWHDKEDAVVQVLQKQLDELYEIANRDSENIKEAVQRIVPTYVIKRDEK